MKTVSSDKDPEGRTAGPDLPVKRYQLGYTYLLYPAPGSEPVFDPALGFEVHTVGFDVRFGHVFETADDAVEIEQTVSVPGIDKPVYLSCLLHVSWHPSTGLTFAAHPFVGDDWQIPDDGYAVDRAVTPKILMIDPVRISREKFQELTAPGSVFFPDANDSLQVPCVRVFALDLAQDSQDRMLRCAVV